MKKTLAALAVLGAFAGSAAAADVQLYGVSMKASSTPTPKLLTKSLTISFSSAPASTSAPAGA